MVEVLVAMLILAMAVSILMRLFSSGLQNISTSADYARAVLIAETRLATSGTSEVIVAGETSGDDDEFRWTRTVEAYAPPELPHREALPLAAYRVSVAVEWPGRVGPRRLSLTTIKLDRSGASGGRP